jgi:acetyltransferase-like isoleucine patch superfamily enzyme
LSFVQEDIPPWAIWAGVPAKFIGPRRKDLLAFEPSSNASDTRE